MNINEFDAQHIKARAIDNLLKNNGTQLICSELAFQDYSRKADLVAIIDNLTHAFEIKSELDNLNSLNEQLIDYEQCFDYVHVIAAEKHLPQIKKIIDKKFGLIKYKNDELINIRKPKLIKRQNKMALLSIATSKELRTLASQKNNQSDKESMKESISKNKTLEIIKNNIRSIIIRRNQEKYHLFLKERGQKTHIDDLIFLSRQGQFKINQR